MGYNFAVKILTVCPTYNRRESFKRMADSFYKTAHSDNVLSAVFPASEKFDYESFPKVKCFANNGTITECLNYVFKKFPHYDFYHITNDDVLYQTARWDCQLIDSMAKRGPGIAYGNDLFQGNNLCTFPFISGEIIRSLGYLQMPKLKRYFGDTIWQALGKAAGCLHYSPDVIIEHLHYYAGKSGEMPENKDYGYDQTQFGKWLKCGFPTDLKVIQELREK